MAIDIEAPGANEAALIAALESLLDGEFAALNHTHAFSGALVKKSANQTAANYTVEAVVAFDTEVYDDGGWHDNAVNNSRFTVPAGVTKVRLSAGVGVELITASSFVQIQFIKNGVALVPTQLNRAEISFAAHYAGFTSAVVPCVAGDYFEFSLVIETDTSVTIAEAFTSFAIEKVA